MNAHPRKFEAVPMDDAPEPLSIGLIGPPGGGKTKSALRIADGMARVRGGDVVVLDTERRARKYRQSHTFKWVPIEPPFKSEHFIEAIREWDRTDVAAIIVDSMSDEHEGEGGHLAWHDEEVPKSGGNAWAAWSKPSASRRKFKTGFLRVMTPLIFTFRAREKTIQVGKEIKNIGFVPVAPIEIVHNLDLTCILPPNANGKPVWKSDKMGEEFFIKNPDYLRHCIAAGQIDEAMGEALARWATGTPDPHATERAAGLAAAGKGSAALKDWWTGLAKPARGVMLAYKDATLKPMAAEVDARQSAEAGSE